MGFAIARKFAANGYAVQLAGRNPERLKPLQSEITLRYNVPCSIHHFDAVQFETHASFYGSLPAKPDVCVYAAGFMDDNEKAVEDWAVAAATIATNYTGAVSILNIIAQDFGHRKSGVIVGISSVAGNRGRQSNYIYGSAKAGFTAYLSGLRNKLFHHGVHVMTVLPGFVATKMTAGLPLPKPLVAQVSEVAGAVYKGVLKKKNVLYVKWFWCWIMLLITAIPEPMFKKKKL